MPPIPPEQEPDPQDSADIGVATAPTPDDQAQPEQPAGDILPQGVTEDGSPADSVINQFESQQQDAKSAQAEAALIRQFETIQAMPEFIKDVAGKFDSHRKYVHTDVMMPGVPDGIGTNLVLRNQYVRLGQAYARDPDLSVQPKRLLAPVPSMMGIQPPEPPQPPPGVQPDPARMQQMQQMVVEQMQQAILGQFKQYLETLGMFGKTVEVLVRHFADECGLRDTLEGMVQDACTVGIAWLKITWQEALGKDPLGIARNNDFADTVAKLTVLAHQFESSEFDKTDPRYQQLIDLSDTIRKQVLAEHWAQANYQMPQTGNINPEQPPQMAAQDPREIAWKSGNPADRAAIAEIPRYRGFQANSVMPEDIRWDWTVTDPKQYRKARWIANRVYMTGTEVCEQYGCTLDDIRGVSPTTGAQKQPDDPRINGVSALTASTTKDPADRETEDQRQINDTFAVWERWDRSLNRVYVWVEGCDWFLSNEVPTVVSKFWYPFFPLFFNRVTGRFLPMPDVELQRNLNDEYNLMRTHDRQGRKASYPFYIGSAGSTDETDRDLIRNRVPYSYIELKKPDEVAKHFQTVAGTPYNPNLYDTSKIRQDMDEMASVPSAARGSVGDAKFSSEVQVANQQMDVQSDRYRDAVERWLEDVFTHMADILVEVFPQANAKAIAGPGAVWPYMDRESLWRNLELDIQAGSAGKPDQQKKLAMWQQFGQICQSLGIGVPGSPQQINAAPVLDEIFNDMNIRREASEFIREAPLPPMGPPPFGGPPGPGGPGPNGPPQGSPAPQKGPPPPVHHGAQAPATPGKPHG